MKATFIFFLLISSLVTNRAHNVPFQICAVEIRQLDETTYEYCVNSKATISQDSVEMSAPKIIFYSDKEILVGIGNGVEMVELKIKEEIIRGNRIRYDLVTRKYLVEE